MEGKNNRSAVAVVIAALNEEKGIGCTLSELGQVLGDPAFLVVDGNSTDKTVEVAKESGAEILIQKGEGKGDAVALAIMHLSGDFKYAILIDADYTYPAEYLPEMIEILEQNPHVGMVCGNRFNGHLDTKALRSSFYFGNRFLAFAHNMLTGVALRDPLTGLRVIRAKILKDWSVKSKGFDVEVELNQQVRRKGFEIIEVPIQYRQRLGEKKLKIKHGATILKRILLETI